MHIRLQNDKHFLEKTNHQEMLLPFFLLLVFQNPWSSFHYFPFSFFRNIKYIEIYYVKTGKKDKGIQANAYMPAKG